MLLFIFLLFLFFLFRIMTFVFQPGLFSMFQYFQHNMYDLGVRCSTIFSAQVSRMISFNEKARGRLQ
jgi:hypothetical protein